LRKIIFISVAGIVLLASVLIAERPRISEDRELKEVDLSAWDCINRPQGSASEPEAEARDRMKNRPPADLAGAPIESMDTAAFLRHVAGFDARVKGRSRSELSAAETNELEQLEKEIVSLTAYLVLIYAGPPEATNCNNTEFHDWHLEMFAQALDHPPRAGDPTPIIAEITPRTQNQLYKSGIRLQSLAGFLRTPDLAYQPTGHAARKVRVTGTLLWDDQHNRPADVGRVIETSPPHEFHHPWRATAWEIHPVTKIEVIPTFPDGKEPAVPR
jgi:hypothetical protein